MDMVDMMDMGMVDMDMVDMDKLDRVDIDMDMVGLSEKEGWVKK